MIRSIVRWAKAGAILESPPTKRSPHVTMSIAGVHEGIEIIIFADGNWEFYADDET